MADTAEAIRKMGLAHIVTFYGVDMSALLKSDARWIDRYHRLFDQVNGVLCEGPHMAKCLGEMGCPSEKLTVHHLGIDPADYPFMPRVWRQGETFRVLIASSFREKKGIPCALRAVAQLRKSLPVEITIIGDAGQNAKSRREKIKILEVVDELGLSDAVRFLGYQPHEVLIAEAYRHHVFLSASRTASDGDSEGGAPVALLEMSATGMPVVSTRHADIPNLIEDGVTGLLADENDPLGLAESLFSLVESPESWLAMTRAARARIEAYFNAPRQGAVLESIYRSSLG